MSPPRISLELLHCLVAVHNERSVTRAAERLNLSQSTVSSALAKLRVIYADPLFVSGRGSLEPTSKAQELVEFLAPSLVLIENSVLPRAAFKPSEATALFQIAMVDFVQDRLLPALRRVIELEAPNLRLSVTPLAIDTVEDSLAAQKLDLAIASTKLTLKNVRFSTVFYETFTSIVRQGHPAVKNGHWTVNAFSELNHLQVSPTGSGYVGMVDRALTDLGLKRKVVLYMPSYHLAAKMIGMSDLVALMPMKIAQDMSKTCSIQLVEPPLPLPKLPVIQMWHERSHADPLHRWLRQRLVEIEQQSG
ncbi:MAG: LysR family transcriptional regulator [Hydrogenophaga sp.]|uniref:LysR family transcriptional regulator n=1 Tax=Hydrogenophaga sp. TaxID=1904254 RepID=UPI0040356807